MSIPAREVRPDEARDLIPWLAKNPDCLSDALGMDLELDGSEVGVGSFSADLLLRDTNTGARVVIENLIGNTDHDHLGKVITYAAGLRARHVVLIAERFRPEHRRALQWLNANSGDSVSFFGIVIKVFRIGDSAPAPRFEVLVQPEEDVRRTHRGRGNEPSEREIAYRDFWSAFLSVFHERYPGWSRARADAPRKDYWIGFPARKAGTYCAVTFCQSNRFRVEIDIHVAADSGEATRRFDAIRKRRDEIEASFGEPLEWEYREGRKETES